MQKNQNKQKNCLSNQIFNQDLLHFQNVKNVCFAASFLGAVNFLSFRACTFTGWSIAAANKPISQMWRGQMWWTLNKVVSWSARAGSLQSSAADPYFLFQQHISGSESLEPKLISMLMNSQLWQPTHTLLCHGHNADSTASASFTPATAVARGGSTWASFCVFVVSAALNHASTTGRAVKWLRW